MISKPNKMTKKNMSMLQLWRLISPALPVGAYAYSQGFEYAIDCEWVTDDKTCLDWIEGILINNLSYLDLPILKRFYSAWQDDDKEAINAWLAYIKASRETKELLLEDKQVGESLARLLTSLDIKQAEIWQNDTRCSYPLMFALAGQHWNIPVADLLLGYVWAWCENQIAVAMKAIPLGQTHGQQIIQSLIPRMDDAVCIAIDLPDDELGRMCPGQVMASSLHEQQYSRLFRS